VMGWKEEDAAPPELGEINRDWELQSGGVRSIPTGFRILNAGTGALETVSRSLRLALRFLFGLHRSDFLPGRCAPQLQASTVKAPRADDVAIWRNHRGP